MIKKCIISNNNPLSPLISIEVSFSNGCIIEDCVVSCNPNTSTGLHLFDSSSCNVKNCNITGNSGSSTVRGILVNSSNNCRVNECQIIGNSSTGTLFGIEVAASLRSLIDNNVILGNNATSDINGIFIDSTSQSSLSIKNLISSNASVSGTSIGINLDDGVSAFGNKSFGHTTSNFDSTVHHVSYNLATGVGFTIAGSTTDVIPYDILGNVEFI